MGEPADLNPEQLSFLRAAGMPRQEAIAADCFEGAVRVHLTLKENAVMRLRILPAERHTDDGYNYSYYCKE